MQKRYTLGDIAKHVQCEVQGKPSVLITGFAELHNATPSDISFFDNPRYFDQMKQSQAIAIVLHPKIETTETVCRNFIRSEQPSYTFQKIVELFVDLREYSTGFTGIHPTAVIHPTAKVHSSAIISPYAVIDRDAEIHENAFIGSFTYVGPSSIIGKNAFIHPHVVLRELTKLGERVIIQPGAVIGSCGYGYHTDNRGTHTKLFHVGSVVIEDDVEVGANTTIDRARFSVTKIGKGTKIDNLVQIAHNVITGNHCLIISQVGIAGSTKIGNHVVLAGKVGVAGHLTLDDQVIVASYSGVTKSLKKGRYSGIPVQEVHVHNRNMALLRSIEKLYERVKLLETQQA